jgi:hypothetical protein
LAISARFTADFASFYQAVQKAEVSLKSFETGAGKVEKTLNRMGDSFSGVKIIQDATLAEKAIEKIGGATKLTAAEQERANKLVTEAIAKYQALGLVAPKALTDLATATSNTVGKSAQFLGDLKTHIVATAAGFVSAQAAIGAAQAGFRMLTKFVGDSVTAYTEAEAIQKKLTVALKQQGPFAVSAAQDYEKLAKQFQRTTAFEDDMITATQAMLVQVGDVMPNQMEGALKATTDLAAGLGIDLQQATMLVGKAFAGNTESLGRYGVNIDEARFKTEGATVVLDAIQRRFGGQAQAELDTYAGKVKQLANEWGNFQEAVGEFIVDDPVVRAGLILMVDAFSKQKTEVKETKDGWVTWMTFMPQWVHVLKGAHDGVKGLAEEIVILSDAARLAQNIKAPDFGGAQRANQFKAGSIDVQKYLADEAKAAKRAEDAIQDYAREQERTAKAVIDAYEDTRRAFVSYYSIIAKAGVANPLQGLADSTKVHIDAINNILIKSMDVWVEYGKAIAKAAKQFDDLGDLNFKLPGRDVTGVVRDLPPQLVAPFRDAFAEFGKELPEIIFGTLQGGGSIVGAMASGLAATFSQQFQKALAKSIKDGTALSTGNKALGVGAVGLGSFVGGFGIGESQGKAVGAVGGAAAGAMAGLPLAAVTGGLSVAVGAVAGFFGGIFGGAKKAKEELKKLRQAQEDIVKHFGSMEKLKDAADDAGVSIGNALKTKNAAEFERFVKRLNEALEKQKERWDGIAPIIGNISQLGGRLPASFQGYIDQLEKGKMLTSDNLTILKQLTGEGETDWKRLQSVAEQYGINLAGLGDKFQAAKLSAGAQQIWDDFQLLIGAGADTNTVLDGMADEIGNLIKNAKQFGVAIPENFRPLIEKLMESGKLLDDNGEAITDLSTLKFSDSIQTSIEKLVDTLQDFLDKLLEIPDAMSRIPRSLDVDFNAGGAGAQDSGGAFGGAPIVIETNIDGEVVARNQVQHVPFALRTAGVI